jgi:hypothetical protein
MLGKAMIAIALVLGAACGKQGDGGGQAAGSTAAAAGSGSMIGNGAIATGSGSTATVGASAPGGSLADAVASGSGTVLGSGELPKECQQWKDAVERLARCDQMPEQARTSLRQAYDTAAAAWSSLPAEDRAHLAGSCLAGANAILESAKLTCGW